MKTLTETQRRVLHAVRQRIEAGDPPPSYRDLCAEFGWSSTGTARDHLSALQRKGYVDLPRHRGGRVTLRSKKPSRPGATDGGRGAGPVGPAASPYATGGGGVTFERKVAAHYLARLLVGDGSSELGDGRRVVSVAFQQAPEHMVDDLVVNAARADEVEPSLVLAVAVRRSPKLVSSDDSTQKLIEAFVDAVLTASPDGPEHRWCLVVAGPQQRLHLPGPRREIRVLA